MTRLLTVPEAAALLGMQVATLRKWISRRRIAVVKFGRSDKAAVRIEPQELERLVALHRRPAVAPAPRRFHGPHVRRLHVG